MHLKFDERDIITVLHHHTTGLDTHDWPWPPVRSCFPTTRPLPTLAT